MRTRDQNNKKPEMNQTKDLKALRIISQQEAAVMIRKDKPAVRKKK